MKWHLLALLILISCAPIAQDVVTKPKMEQQIEAPRTEPVLEPQIKVPQEVEVPEIVEQPEPVQQPKLSPKEECIQNCENNCAATAQNACTQRERSKCRGMCNDNPAIDPSACTQACAFLHQPNVCKQQVEKFCSAQCVGYCH